MTSNFSSRLSGFYKKSIAARRQTINDLLAQPAQQLFSDNAFSTEQADRFVENAVGVMGIPVGIAVNFVINKRDYLVPMAVEEPSVIAAASNAARLVRRGGGFTATANAAHTVAQIELLGGRVTADAIEALRDQVVAKANATQPQLVQLGGGVVDVVLREKVGSANRAVVHLVVDCKDAMGANMVNTMAESVAPFLCTQTGAQAGLKILSNLADQRLATAQCEIPISHLDTETNRAQAVADGIVAASDFAAADPYRAATHNKGIFNGIDPVLVVTGNDWRAVEAGGHAFACKEGHYSPLATWRIENGALCGTLTLPMAVGIVGGASRHHPQAADAIEMMQITSAQQLAMIATCAGLASNLAALRALSTEGIQAGHMRLHQKRLEP